jgi:hypothetical protein
MEMIFKLTSNNVASGAGVGDFQVNMPTGYTVPSTYQYPMTLGSAGTFGLVASGQFDRTVQVVADSSSTLAFIKPVSAVYYARSDLNVAYATEFYAHISVPIAEWAGSGTVNLAQNDVEYAYNTSTSTSANDETSFGYGPGGALIQNITAGIARTVRFQTPFQVGDYPIVEMSLDRRTWVPAGSVLESYPIDTLHFNGTDNIGIGAFVASSLPNTDVKVYFGKYATGTTVSWTTVGGSAIYWRVRKSAAGAAVGFGIVVPGTSSGLVSASGLPGNTTGNAIASGYVGELFGTQRAGTGGSSYSTRATTAFPSSIGSLVSYTLNKGVYLVSYMLGGYTASGTSNVESYIYVGGVAVTTLLRSDATTAGITGGTASVPIVISSDSTVVAVYGLVNGGLSVTAPTQEMHIVRIA